MTMVAAISPGGMQPHDHLVPPPIFAQVLRKPCQLAMGQPFQLLHHLLTFVHGVETLHPKHNLDLDFQRQHATKRFVSEVHQPSAVHDDSAQWDLSALVYLIHGFLGPITHSRQDLGSHPKKSVPMGGTP